MIFTVINRNIEVGDIRSTGVSSSSLLLIGDTDSVYLSSIFDTPPESLIIGTYVPLAWNNVKAHFTPPERQNQFSRDCECLSSRRYE